MREFFAARGLDYNPHPDVVPNSMSALRLTELARDLGKHAGGARPDHGRVLGRGAEHRRRRRAAHARRRGSSCRRTRSRTCSDERPLPRPDRRLDTSGRVASARTRCPPSCSTSGCSCSARSRTTSSSRPSRSSRSEHEDRRRDRDAFGWIEEEPSARTSHALEVEGRVWLFDVVDWPELDARVRELGEPAGVVQLLDRHSRDCAAVAQRLGVPHLVVPRQLPGTPFELRPVVRFRWWREVALWWEERRLLLVADADRHDPVLLRGRGAGRRPPVSSAVAAALAPRPRPRSPARRARRGDPPASGGAGERAADGAAADPALARRPAAAACARRASGRGRAVPAGRAAAAPSAPRPGPAG